MFYDDSSNNLQIFEEGEENYNYPINLIFLKEINDENRFSNSLQPTNETDKENEKEKEKETDKKNKIEEEEENNNEGDIICQNSMNNDIYTNNVQNKIFKKEEEKTFISQKSKRTKTKKPTNLSDDYMRRQCKRLVLDNLLDFINYKIRFFYNNNIGKGICIKQLQNLNQKQKSESNVEFNKQFLNQKIGDIFSNISGRYTSFRPNHNRDLIQLLKNHEDFTIKNYFNRLFNLTFTQCISHFRESAFYEELKGMRLLKDELNNDDYDQDYVDNLKYYINKYEHIINGKKGRQSKKTKDY